MKVQAQDHVTQQLLHVKALFDEGRYGAAADTVMDLWRSSEGGVDLALECIQPLLGCRKQALVSEICETELARGREDQRLLVLAGRMSLVRGQFERARLHLCRAADRAPTDGGLLQLLANAQRYSSSGHEDFGRFESLLLRTDVDRGERELAGFALAKACDDIGDFERSASLLQSVNRWAAESANWNAGRWQEFVEAVVSLRIRHLPRPVVGEACPLFVVGLPRSGTTLVADLLGRHPEVCNRHELPWIWLLWEQLLARNGFANPGLLAEAAANYFRHLIRDDPPRRWYVDKNPFNFRSLPIIDALFPNARVIYCRRGMRDAALSMWQQRFAAPENDFSYRLDHIADFAHGCTRLIAGLRGRLRVPVFDLRYEDLVERPQETFNALGRFLGLSEFDPFSVTSEQAVATASVWQVRQPIYGRSVGRWRHYAPFVPELTSIFPES